MLKSELILKDLTNLHSKIEVEHLKIYDGVGDKDLMKEYFSNFYTKLTELKENTDLISDGYFSRKKQFIEIQKELENTVFHHYGVSRDEFEKFSDTRKQPYALIRSVLMYVAYYRLNSTTMEQIGQIYKRDHATVVNSRKVIDNLIFSDKNFAMFFDKLIIDFNL